METLKIEILNPKAKKLLLELADLQLISIKSKTNTISLEQLLTKLRKDEGMPSMEDITSEVEAVRKKRHENKAD